MKLGNLEVFGRPAELSNAQLRACLERLDPDDTEALYHLTRHFRELPEAFRAGILGRIFVPAAGGAPVTLDAQAIAAALATRGSKFATDGDGFSDPRAALVSIHEAVIARASAGQIQAIDFGGTVKCFLALDRPGVVGWDSVVLVESLAPSLRARLRRVQRGRCGEDIISVNVLTGHPPQATSRMGVIVGIDPVAISARLLTAHPGSLCQPFPAEDQSPEEIESNRRFWELRAFLD